MATSTRLATGSLPGRQISLARVATALRTWQGALAATLLLALFLRVYGMALQGWTPDTYEQMASTQRLVGGEFRFRECTRLVSQSRWHLSLPSCRKRWRRCKW